MSENANKKSLKIFESVLLNRKYICYLFKCDKTFFCFCFLCSNDTYSKIYSILLMKYNKMEKQNFSSSENGKMWIYQKWKQN